MDPAVRVHTLEVEQCEVDEEKYQLGLDSLLLEKDGSADSLKLKKDRD